MPSYRSFHLLQITSLAGLRPAKTLEGEDARRRIRENLNDSFKAKNLNLKKKQNDIFKLTVIFTF